MGMCMSRPKNSNSESLTLQGLEDIPRDTIESDNEVDLDLTEGVYLSEIANDLDSELPKYILFKPNDVIVHKQYLKCIEHQKKLSEKDFNQLQFLANSDSSTTRDNQTNNLVYISNREYLSGIKKKCLDSYYRNNTNITIDKSVLNDDIHITFYNNDFKSYVIYKKLRVKFDIYYIPLSIYNAIKTEIQIMKTINPINCGMKFHIGKPNNQVASLCCSTMSTGL